MTVILTALTVAFIFYAALPLAGAFMVRSQWRTFRQQVVDASSAAEVTYSHPDRKNADESGIYSFCGGLQAIQGESCIWLKNNKVSVRAELKDLKIYLLPTSRSINDEGRKEENKSLLPGDMPRKIKWEKVYSLPQGTEMLIAGRVFIDNGVPVFRNTKTDPLLVIIYDGSRDTILRRSIWSGRQLNEYWNTFTPLSLISGSFFLFVLLFINFRQFGGTTLVLQTALLTFLPLVPFFPPGIAFYFLFRFLWRNARYLRGERDLLRLPLRFPEFSEEDSCDAALKKHPEAKIRSCGVISVSDLNSIKCRVYCSGEMEDSAVPVHFYENLIIPGDPGILAQKCRSRARIFEILAAASISTGFIINLLLFYFILLRFI